MGRTGRRHSQALLRLGLGAGRRVRGPRLRLLPLPLRRRQSAGFVRLGEPKRFGRRRNRCSDGGEEAVAGSEEAGHHHSAGRPLRSVHEMFPHLNPPAATQLCSPLSSGSLHPVGEGYPGGGGGWCWPEIPGASSGEFLPPAFPPQIWKRSQFRQRGCDQAEKPQLPGAQAAQRPSLAFSGTEGPGARPCQLPQNPQSGDPEQSGRVSAVPHQRRAANGGREEGVEVAAAAAAETDFAPQGGALNAKDPTQVLVVVAVGPFHTAAPTMHCSGHAPPSFLPSCSRLVPGVPPRPGTQTLCFEIEQNLGNIFSLDQPG